MKPKKLKEALLPILIINWMSGLGIAQYPLGTPRFFFSFIYLIILFSGIFYIPVTQGLNTCQITKSWNVGVVIYNGIKSYEEFHALIYVIISWNYQKALESCIQRIELIDETLECIGSKDNYGRTFNLLLLRIFSYLILMFIFTVIKILFHIQLNVPNKFYCAFKSQIIIHLTTILEMTFAILVRCVGFYMGEINRLLQRDVEKSKLESNYIVNRKHHSIIRLVMSEEFNSKTDDPTFEKTKNLVQLLKQLHLNLSKIGWDLNKIYGLQITIVMSINVIFLTLDLYYLFIGILNTENFDYAIILTVTLIGSNAILHIIKIAYLNNVCGNVAKEAKKTQEIIFELNRGNKNTALTKEIEQFAMQIGQRPLNFVICGLFTLQNRFIITVLGTVVTYLVFMLQSEPIKNQVIELEETIVVDHDKISN